jgi:hypothetical protein
LSSIKALLPGATKRRNRWDNIEGLKVEQHTVKTLLTRVTKRMEQVGIKTEGAEIMQN